MQRKGFTLVELLIGSMIGAIVLMSVYVAFNATTKYWNKTNSATTAQQTARYASDHMSRNLKVATASGTGGATTYTLTTDAASQFLTFTQAGVQSQYRYDFPTPGGGGMLFYWPNISTSAAQPLTGANVQEGTRQVNAVKILPVGTNTGIFSTDGSSNGTHEAGSTAIVYIDFIAQDTSAVSNSQTAKGAQQIEIRTAVTYPHL